MQTSTCHNQCSRGFDEEELDEVAAKKHCEWSAEMRFCSIRFSHRTSKRRTRYHTTEKVPWNRPQALRDWREWLGGSDPTDCWVEPPAMTWLLLEYVECHSGFFSKPRRLCHDKPCILRPLPKVTNFPKKLRPVLLGWGTFEILVLLTHKKISTRHTDSSPLATAFPQTWEWE